jgi:hypothetical protein
LALPVGSLGGVLILVPLAALGVVHARGGLRAQNTRHADAHVRNKRPPRVLQVRARARRRALWLLMVATRARACATPRALQPRRNCLLTRALF